MSKNSIIKSLGKCIGNVVMHKLLLKHTNRPESRNHLNSEIMEYGADVFEKTQTYYWNENDRVIMKNKAINRVKNLSIGYSDVVFDESEIEISVNEMIKELLD